MNDLLNQEFLRACGADRPVSLYIEQQGGKGAICLRFHQPYIVVGRSHNADLRLLHADVSSIHSYLQVVNGNLFCFDLQSRTGTRWKDGERSQGWVSPISGIRIGPFIIHPTESSESDRNSQISPTPGEDDPFPTSRSFPQDREIQGFLEFIDPGVDLPPWPMNRVLAFLGSSQKCSIRLSNPGIGKVHVGLMRTSSSIWAIDLLGPSGLVVNGVRRRLAQLNDGDEIQLGSRSLRLRYAPASSREAMKRLPGPPQSAQGGVMALRQAFNFSQTPSMLNSNQMAVGQPEMPPALVGALLGEFGLMQNQMADQFQQAMAMMLQMFAGMHQEQMGTIRDEISRLRKLMDEQQRVQAEMEKRSATRTGDASRRFTPRPSESSQPSTSTSPKPTSPPSQFAPNMKQRPSQSVDEDEVHDQLAQRLAAIHHEREGLWKKIASVILK